MSFYPPPTKNGNIEPVSIFEKNVNNAYGSESFSDSIFGTPSLNQSIEGDSGALYVTDLYTFGNTNDPNLTVKRTTNYIDNSRTDNVNIKVAQGTNVYNTSNYDKEGRLLNTTTGVEQTLYEEKVKDSESGEDKIKRRISAFGEYTKPQLGNSEPETNFGVTCRVGNSTVRPTITNTGARNLSVGTTIGETDLEAMWSKNGLQSVSIGGKIGHNTYAKIGIEGAREDKPNYNATLRHQKKSSNPNCDKPITEEVSLNYRDKNSFGAKYTVYNKDTSSWGISYNQEGDNKKLFGFFNMPL